MKKSSKPKKNGKIPIRLRNKPLRIPLTFDQIVEGMLATPPLKKAVKGRKKG